MGGLYFYVWIARVFGVRMVLYPPDRKGNKWPKPKIVCCATACGAKLKNWNKESSASYAGLRSLDLHSQPSRDQGPYMPLMSTILPSFHAHSFLRLTLGNTTSPDHLVTQLTTIHNLFGSALQLCLLSSSNLSSFLGPQVLSPKESKFRPGSQNASQRY